MQNQSYSLKDITTIVWKNIILIVILGVVGGGVFFAYAKHKQKTVYSVERSLVINHSENRSDGYKQVKSDLQMIPTYTEIIQGKQISDDAYQNMSKKNRHKYSKKDFESKVTASAAPNSSVINVKATADDAGEVVAIVNNTVQTAKMELPKIQPGLGKIYTYSKVSIKDVQSQKTGSVKKYTLVGVALGVLVGMLISFTISTKKHLL